MLTLFMTNKITEIYAIKLKLVSTMQLKLLQVPLEVLQKRLYQELGFEYLSSRRWLRKICTFHRIARSKSPSYL